MLKKIAVILGGTSPEHEISLKSGRFIYETLSRDKYLVKAIPITKKGDWIIPVEFNHPMPELQKELQGMSETFMRNFREIIPVKAQTGDGMSSTDSDLVFIGLHGGEGENGTIQSILFARGIPFTGSGVLASALAMDKYRSNLLFKSVGLNVPEFIEINKIDFEENPGESLRNIKMNFPLFVKPTLGGSSVGAGKADTLDELSSRISEIFRMEDRALVQELITGTEVSCGVFEKKEKGRFIPFALPVTEILPGGEFFDYDSKYKDGGSKEITPARINGELTKKVQESAIVAHTLLGCSGYSRTDFIIRNNIPYILETNTLPGMTATSLIPQQVKNIGLSMETFFDYLIERALQN